MIVTVTRQERGSSSAFSKANVPHIRAMHSSTGQLPTTPEVTDAKCLALTYPYHFITKKRTQEQPNARDAQSTPWGREVGAPMPSLEVPPPQHLPSSPNQKFSKPNI